MGQLPVAHAHNILPGRARDWRHFRSGDCRHFRSTANATLSVPYTTYMLFFKLRTQYTMYWNVPQLGGGINNIWHFILLWGHSPMWLNISPPWRFVIWSIIWKVCHVKQLDVPSVSCKTTWCTICRWVLSDVIELGVQVHIFYIARACHWE
jgi:hypothetical protein